ncbi:MAG: DegT/DnrJ/EryC1/StrS family aminotransferase, partial [Chloroflexota bacterium]
FVDIDPDTLNIDPDQVAEAAERLAEGRGGKGTRRQGEGETRGRLKAILPVDAFGQPADYDPIREVADEYGLVIIEDSCEAIGAEYKGRKAGTLGDVGVFAFYPNKQMTTGEGGMIVTDRDDWAELFRSLRNQGRDGSNTWLNHVRLGYNYRMDEMSAALGLSQIERIDDLLAQRTQVTRWYDQRLADVEGVETPYVAPATTRMSWFVYVIRITAKVGRDRVMEVLREQGIPSRPYFTPIHLQPFYVDRFGYREGDFPVTEEAGNKCLALPFSSVMTEEQVDVVCDALRAALRE